MKLTEFFDNIFERIKSLCGNKDAEIDNTPEGLYNLGSKYYEKGTESGDKKAFEYFKQSADLGNADAQCALGECYFVGKGTTPNPELAVQYYTMAADQGNANAMYELGYCYESVHVLGDAIDLIKSLEFYKQAAERGHLNALSVLAYKYLNGSNVPVNIAEAVKYFILAHKVGYIDAKVKLKELADGGNADAIEALKHLDKTDIVRHYILAYKAGYMDAKAMLEKLADEGNADAIEALKHLDKAA